MPFYKKLPPGVTYRRLNAKDGSLPWHFRNDCPLWPVKNYTEQDELPERQQLCSLCIDRHQGDPAATLS